ncbi:disintegrin and metalloproteinase domain-containing protein 10 [Leucoraja erinacea]|uniref:disintegrin and metalloproteinase domain-containing protein 10 n=1 Tax=Leucoraja erinaceus TaxID=7782 RepID=UPI002456117F|nr:disintegrin and metalloproteinase domain-containing protein 10 [Leucoraja erinacea]
MRVFTTLLPLIIYATDRFPEGLPGPTGAGPVPLLRRFEGLRYDRDSVSRQQTRTRRWSLAEEPRVQLQFTAHRRQFHLQLKRDLSMFTEDFRIETRSGLEYADLSHIYSGQLQGENSSHCHGSIIDGRFEGFIQTQKGRYYVEPAERYGQGEHPAIHSIIYHQDDVDSSHLQSQGPSCLSRSVLCRYQDFQESSPQEALHSRPKRSVEYSRTTCLLHLYADHLYTKRLGDSKSVTAQISSYMKAVNEIYENVNFAGIRQINFKVKKLVIDSEYNETNPLHGRFISVDKLLELFSKRDWSEYCLSYLLSDRDYDGILGVAWLAKTGDSGGICSRTHNTGLITLQKYGVQIPTRMVHITLAHELGHSLGSPHDEGKECIPEESSASQGNDGNYLMYPYASDGLEYNNDRLSPCTIQYISKVLMVKKDQCFAESGRPICGNQLVEEGEECDVGQSSNDPCCYSAREPIEVSCKLKPGALCSPTQGRCCSPQCVLATHQQQCSRETECAFESYCNGVSPACPDSSPKENHTLCHQGLLLCVNGQCSGSLCIQHGLQQCSCGTQSTEEECYLCCQKTGDAQTCASSSSALLQRYFNGTLRSLPPGSPCRKKQGYCDKFNKCRLVDDDGPIARLKNAIFHPKDFEDISEWMKEHWWAVLLGILALGALMASTVFIFGKALDSEEGEAMAELQTFQREVKVM